MSNKPQSDDVIVRESGAMWDKFTRHLWEDYRPQMLPAYQAWLEYRALEGTTVDVELSGQSAQEKCDALSAKQFAAYDVWRTAMFNAVAKAGKR
jgi:hypothetical protein